MKAWSQRTTVTDERVDKIARYQNQLRNISPTASYVSEDQSGVSLSVEREEMIDMFLGWFLGGPGSGFHPTSPNRMGTEEDIEPFQSALLQNSVD